MDFKKRAPAVEKLIKEIDPYKDFRVKVTGYVVELISETNSFLLSDPTGKINVLLEDEHLLHNLKVGDFVSVIGTILNLEGDFEIKLEIIQNFNKINKELFYKVHEYVKKVNEYV